MPDFLGLLDAPDAELAGQDELVPDALSRELDRRRDTVTELAHRFGLGVPATTKIIEQRIRLGQHRFATAVVRAFDHTCAFCGYRPASVLGHRLLVASHIKPWADCCDLERLDTRNGVAACPVHDAAFDTGLPAVDDGLTIWLSRALAASLARDDGAAAYFGRGVLRASLVLPSGVAPPAPEYLRNHREQVFADRPS